MAEARCSLETRNQQEKEDCRHNGLRIGSSGGLRVGVGAGEARASSGAVDFVSAQAAHIENRFAVLSRRYAAKAGPEQLDLVVLVADEHCAAHHDAGHCQKQ
jgi:hypothetical protein